MANLNRPKAIVSQESAPVKKKGEGFLKALGTINDGLSAYNNAKNGVNINQPSVTGNSSTSNGQIGNWTAWKSIDCFPRITVRAQFYNDRRDGSTNGVRLEFKNGYSYGIEFNFTYGAPLDVKELLENLNQNHGGASTSGTHTIPANGILKSGLTIPYATSLNNYYNTIIVYGPFMKAPTSQESSFLKCENGTICDFCKYEKKQAIKYNNSTIWS